MTAPRCSHLATVSPPARRLARGLGTLAAVGLLGSALAGCNTLQRLAEIGDPPSMSEVENPTLRRDYKPVTMPMPTPQVATPNPNSLWRPGARAFFKDQRASDVGDILTVVVDIENEQASLNNSLSQGRTSGEGAGLDNFFGYEAGLTNIFPNELDPSNLVNFGSNSEHQGSGNIARAETINIRLAAVVIQVLPNGNLVISGRQEVRVSGELRELTVSGVIRSQDVRSDNTIDWDKIAEARISYGGRGSVTDLTEPRYGQQLYDILFPF
ncbi:flagellar basal body L-ring protein FlgH [Roseospira marina]|uniref:Flagellar L-ring protein n=1 Tax=Roseospira marina TaxID=140057 RepID=A0A5M6IEQ1_9PROT|nr:flagellar basal body L-ring protein FlgH [Roseospira marina]KAA5606756.1 flagellar basal body L-ring protein FlgH [Roseospira marina]MBB4313822.1 flagellar L-ring protein precursor FlgH [Roseospira marina]MBB5086984.1 flagellar L-ring protein precursor FlgH [Roseospira marina]